MDVSALLAVPLQLPVVPSLLAAVLLIVYLYRYVKYLRYQQFSAWPQRKPSLLFGHADIFKESSVGPHAHSDYLFSKLHDDLGRPPAFVTDMRPFLRPLLVIADHNMAEQISKASKKHPWSVPKSKSLVKRLGIITGKKSIIYMEGEEWKELRRRFNPGFSPQHLLGFLPCILDKTQYFLDRLDHCARTGETVPLAELTYALTIDIIGSVVMNLDLKAQLPDAQQNQIVPLFHGMLRTYYGRSSLMPQPIQFFKRWRASRTLTGLLRSHVTQEFQKLKSGLPLNAEAKKNRSVLTLSLQGLDELNPAVRDSTCDQLRSFLLAGHDTTSVTLQWALYELARTPRALATLRRELDDVFGPDPDPAAVRARLLAPDGGEELVHKMPFSSAIIKETLRLYPPAGTGREPPGMTLSLPDGSASPALDGLSPYLCHYLIQRDRAVYGDTADIWVPERWLGNIDTWMASSDDVNDDIDDKKAASRGGGSGDTKSTGIPASSWRPFERGPRNCIGQELANIELRVILACVVRKFDFTKIGLGSLELDAAGRPMLDAHGQYQTASMIYNTSLIVATPIDGMLMKVRLAEPALSEGK